MQLRLKMTVDVDGKFHSISEDKEVTELKTSDGYTVFPRDLWFTTFEFLENLPPPRKGIVGFSLHFKWLKPLRIGDAASHWVRVPIVFNQFQGKNVRILSGNAELVPNSDEFRDMLLPTNM